MARGAIRLLLKISKITLGKPNKVAKELSNEVYNTHVFIRRLLKKFAKEIKGLE